MLWVQYRFNRCVWQGRSIPIHHFELLVQPICLGEKLPKRIPTQSHSINFVCQFPELWYPVHCAYSKKRGHASAAHASALQ